MMTRKKVVQAGIFFMSLLFLVDVLADLVARAIGG